LAALEKFLIGRMIAIGRNARVLRMADVPEVVRLLSEQLRFEDQLLAAESATRKSKKKAAKRWIHSM
jgi:hypothetical protein